MSEHTIPFLPTKLTFIQLIRFYIRSTLLVGWMYCVGWLTKFGLFLLAPLPRTRLRFRRFMFKRLTGGMLKLMKVRVKVTGKRPKTPYILMGNHISYVDILVIAYLTGTPFVAKKEVRAWPLIGWLAQLYGGLFIDRENRNDVTRFPDLLSNYMKNNDSMAIFPEGTSTSGQSVLPFHSSLFQWPAENAFPVHTCSISYKTGNPKKTPANYFVCWWGDMDFGPHYRLLINLKRIQATIHFSEEVVVDGNRKALAKKAQQSVVEHFIQTES